MRMKVTDHTDSLDVNMYDNEAKKMFGCEAEEYARVWEDGKERGDEGALKETTSRVVWHRFSLKVRAQKEVWQDEERIKYACTEVSNVDFAGQARQMLAEVHGSFVGQQAAPGAAAGA